MVDGRKDCGSPPFPDPPEHWSEHTKLLYHQIMTDLCTEQSSEQGMSCDRGVAVSVKPFSVERLHSMGGKPYWHVGLLPHSAPPHWDIMPASVAAHPEDYSYGENWLAFREEVNVEQAKELIPARYLDQALNGGCTVCGANCAMTDWGDGMPHEYRVAEGAIFFFDSQFGWEGTDINYCPQCGRALREK